MIIEIIEVLRIGIVAVIQSAINTSKIVITSMIKAFVIFRDGVNTAPPLEIVIVLSVFAFIGYMVFKFLEGSAAQFAKFIVILIILFVLTVMIL
ncbi:MAG: hypothetical protein DRN71_04600 [Candidatus Nanohalarchaeota archaeon]|nr:MAG: hypothetical protein DRN71_04600 [Candidatus Nanohaloarchaeota archaeon]